MAEARPVPRGPRGGPPMRGMPRKKLKKGTAKRMFMYMFKGNMLKLFLVVLCILISAVASISSSLFIQTLIDDHITPILSMAVPDFSGLIMTIIKMAALFLC